jgi:hypothetical protein
MELSPVTVTLAFTVMWFVIYWLLAGVLFAVVGLVRFMRINTARFSCLFTLFSFATAYGAAWTGFAAITKTNGRCLANVDALYEVIPGLFRCSPAIVVSNGVLWFIVLLAVGIGLMFVSRLPDRPRPVTKG